MDGASGDLQARKIAEQHNFQTPIDEVDAAARILDPVFDGINSGTNVWGQFLKVRITLLHLWETYLQPSFE
jgi:hypothetical protein